MEYGQKALHIGEMGPKGGNHFGARSKKGEKAGTGAQETGRSGLGSLNLFVNCPQIISIYSRRRTDGPEQIARPKFLFLLPPWADLPPAIVADAVSPTGPASSLRSTSPGAGPMAWDLLRPYFLQRYRNEGFAAFRDNSKWKPVPIRARHLNTWGEKKMVYLFVAERGGTLARADNVHN